jgi:hypothetical protein
VRLAAGHLTTCPVLCTLPAIAIGRIVAKVVGPCRKGGKMNARQDKKGEGRIQEYYRKWEREKLI